MKEKKKPNIKILVACHKVDPNIRQDDIYMPIQVGAAIHPELNLGFQKDNTGDNISEKNPYYCELTAIYWAWKNLKDVDYIGLCHYRRYFNFKKKGFFLDEQEQFDLKQYKNLKKELIPTIIDNKVDVILPKSRSFSDSIIKNHIQNNNYIDFSLMEKYILDNYPEYRSSLIKVFYHTNKVPQRNMFIMKWEWFDKYCNFLFNILFELEKYLKPSRYKYFSRIYGFMGEIILPLFVYHNKLNIETKQIIFINDLKEKEFILKKLLRFGFDKLKFLINTKTNKRLYSEWKEPILRQEFPELYK